MTKPIQHDFKGLTDFFPVFKAGTQTDSKGQTKTWTTDELDQIVSNTKARSEKNLFAGSPFVVGHPTTDAPAYGWVLDVKRDGNDLFVKGDKVHDEFANGVEAGRYPNRSVRIGKDQNGFYLAHVGFLGAAPPAVDLGPVYSANEAVFFDYAINEVASVDAFTPEFLSRLARKFREFIIARFDAATAEEVVTGWEVDSIAAHAARMNLAKYPEQSLTSFNKPEPKGDDPMPREYSEAEIEQIKKDAADEAKQKADSEYSKQISDKDTELKTERNTRLTAEFTAEINGLVSEGKLTPAQAEGMSDFMLQLDSGDEASFEFSAGEGDKAVTHKKTPLEFFRDFTARLGKQVDMGESDAGDDHAASVNDFVAAHGVAVDADRLKLHQKAMDYQAKHDGVDYVSAVRIVEQQEG